MREWMDLVLGLGVLFTLQREPVDPVKREREISRFHLKLFAALAVVVTIQNVCTFFVWSPSGRWELAWATLFLWCVLLHWAVNGFKKKDRGKGALQLPVSRFSLALFAFSFWTMGGGGPSLSSERLLLGLTLPFATGALEWLLGGLLDRLQLAQVPKRAEGAPIIFWLVMLLALVICKLG